MKNTALASIAVSLVFLATGCPKKEGATQTGGAEATLTKEQAVADAAHCVKSMKQMQIAADNYRDTNRSVVPPAALSIQRKPTALSWRVALLPFLEQDEVFKALAASPAMQAPAPATGAAEQVLPPEAQAPIPAYTLPRYQGKDRPETTIFRRVMLKDRPSDLVVIETSDRVAWARAGDEITLEPGKGLPAPGRNFPGGRFALCADGHIRFLPANLEDKAIAEVLATGKGVPALVIDFKAAEPYKQAVENLPLLGPS